MSEIQLVGLALTVCCLILLDEWLRLRRIKRLLRRMRHRQINTRNGTFLSWDVDVLEGWGSIQLSDVETAQAQREDWLALQRLA